MWSVHKTTTEVYSWLGAGCHGGGGGVVVMVTLEAEAVVERGWPGNFGAMRRVCVFSSAAAVAVEYAAAAAAAGEQAVFRLLFVPPHIFIEWTRTEKSNQVNWTAIKMSRLAT